MLGYFKDRNTLCLKYLDLDPVLDKPVLATTYLAQPGSVLLLFKKHLSLHCLVEHHFLSAPGIGPNMEPSGDVGLLVSFRLSNSSSFPSPRCVSPVLVASRHAAVNRHPLAAPTTMTVE